MFLLPLLYRVALLVDEMVNLRHVAADRGGWCKVGEFHQGQLFGMIAQSPWPVEDFDAIFVPNYQ